MKQFIINKLCIITTVEYIIGWISNNWPSVKVSIKKLKVTVTKELRGVGWLYPIIYQSPQGELCIKIKKSFKVKLFGLFL